MGSWLSWLAVYFQFCQKVWLGLHDGRPPAGRDETRMRDVMAQRYDKKRWYVQPTDAFYEEARRFIRWRLNSKQSANHSARRHQTTYAYLLHHCWLAKIGRCDCISIRTVNPCRKCRHRSKLRPVWSTWCQLMSGQVLDIKLGLAFIDPRICSLEVCHLSALNSLETKNSSFRTTPISMMMMIMMMMKLPILPCAEKLELVLSTAPKTWDNTDKDSKNRKRSH